MSLRLGLAGSSKRGQHGAATEVGGEPGSQVENRHKGGRVQQCPPSSAESSKVKIRVNPNLRLGLGLGLGLYIYIYIYNIYYILGRLYI